MPENRLSTLKDQEIITFEEIKRLTKLVFIPAGYVVQLKNLDNIILWEDPQTVQLRGDMIGQKCYHVNFGRDTPCPLCTAFNSIEKMTPQIKEDRSIIDGKWYRVVAIPILFNNKLAAIELIKEITNEKLKGQIFDSVLSIDSTILNITRHDIPNYLHTVNMALEGMLASKTETDDNKQLLEIAYTNTTRAIQILGDLRELSKLEHPFDNLGPVNVAQILEQVQKDVVSHHPNKEINITIQAGISLDKSVIIANELLSEVFMNIFTNSIKFTSETSVMLNITIDKIVRDQEFISVKITDFGQGIPPEVKDFIFDRATRIKNGWRPTKESTGLGMTIIKSLVDFFGGDISYQNRVEDDWTKGTTVTLLFPLAIQSILD